MPLLPLGRAAGQSHAYDASLEVWVMPQQTTLLQYKQQR